MFGVESLNRDKYKLQPLRNCSDTQFINFIIKLVSPEEESTPPPPSTRPESKLRPLDYYYQFISVNVVDGTSRGGDGDNLVTLTVRTMHVT